MFALRLFSIDPCTPGRNGSVQTVTLGRSTSIDCKVSNLQGHQVSPCCQVQVLPGVVWSICFRMGKNFKKQIKSTPQAGFHLYEAGILKMGWLRQV